MRVRGTVRSESDIAYPKALWAIVDDPKVGNLVLIEGICVCITSVYRDTFEATTSHASFSALTSRLEPV
jgi:riboflavin synthase alpha subunit